MKLRKRTGLILVGAQGAGKTSLALEIGTAHGDTLEIQAADLEPSLLLGRFLLREPACLVVDGAPNARGMEILKDLLVSEEVLCNRMFQDPVTVETPHIIVTVDSRSFDSLPMHKDDRRWRVVCVQKVDPS